MATSNPYRWRARADPVNALWPLVPALLDDEVMSSWLVRCALCHGCEPVTLTTDVWPDFRIWCLDPDRKLSKEHLIALSRRAGMTIESLDASTLRPLQQKMTGTAFFQKGIAAWFLCLGVRNRRRSGGLQYCPQCFAEEVPHYLIQDRLAWHTVCSIHHVGLLDHCECCHAPLCPQLLSPPELDLGRCHRCGYELRLASPGGVEEDALRFQLATDALFFAVPQFYGQQRLALNQWLALAKWMIGVLRAGASAHSSCTNSFFEGLGVSHKNLVSPSTGLAFEYLPPSERGILLANVWRMIQAGPEQLLKLARRDDIRPSLLIPRTASLPTALAELRSVLKPQRQNHDVKNHTEQPLSPDRVLMRWQRLLRKFER